MIQEIEKINNIVGLSEHSTRVSKLCLKLAQNIELDKLECKKIYVAAKNHDIGKCFIPKHITNKPAALSDKEFLLMKKHPIYSCNFLKSKGECEDICVITKHHHENYDGTGYPEGLKGNNIPLGARIIRVCDVYDALTNDRVYRDKLQHYMALELMIKEENLYDPLVLETFIYLISKEKIDIKKVVSSR